MKAFKSSVKVDSAGYRTNRAAMLALLGQLADLNKRAAEMSERRKQRFEERGQLTPRERLSRLLDPGMPFLELGNLAGYLMDTDDPASSVPGGSVVAGVGFVSGVRTMIVVDDSGINAGAMTASGGKKLLRAQAISLDQKLPFVHLVESAGANLMQYAVESFVESGEMFYNLARLSARGIPVIAVLHGAATAGGAYMPGMSDYVVAVQDRGKAFLAGPALLQAATGEIATEDELGGARMHATTTGLVEYLVGNDAEAMETCRAIIARLGWNDRCRVPVRSVFSAPTLDPEDILGLVPVSYGTAYDAREVIARFVDRSELLDFKTGYGVTVVCTFGEVYGRTCGIIANNGPIDADGAAKAAQFMQLCEQSELPLVFLQNITGYMVGVDHERSGMIKHGSKMIQAMSNVSVPRITLMIGASFGAGNYGMCGRGFAPDFLFSWPNARTGVMGGEQAARTMSLVAEQGARRRGIDLDVSEQNEQSRRLRDHFDAQSSAFYTSGRGLDDGVVDPRGTRMLLGFLLDTCIEARNRQVSPNSFGISRF